MFLLSFIYYFILYYNYIFYIFLSSILAILLGCSSTVQLFYCTIIVVSSPAILIPLPQRNSFRYLLILLSILSGVSVCYPTVLPPPPCSSSAVSASCCPEIPVCHSVIVLPLPQWSGSLSSYPAILYLCISQNPLLCSCSAILVSCYPANKVTMYFSSATPETVQ
jgi:hypothetical protein